MARSVREILVAAIDGPSSGASHDLLNAIGDVIVALERAEEGSLALTAQEAHDILERIY